MAPNTFSWKRRGVEGKEFSVAEVKRVAEVIGLTTFAPLTGFSRTTRTP